MFFLEQYDFSYTLLNRKVLVLFCLYRLNFDGGNVNGYASHNIIDSVSFSSKLFYVRYILGGFANWTIFLYLIFKVKLDSLFNNYILEYIYKVMFCL